MTRLSLAAAVAAMALFVTASMHAARADDSSFKGYTKMPPASTTHAYTPAPATQGPKTYSPYTKLPPGSVAQAPHPAESGKK